MSNRSGPQRDGGGALRTGQIPELQALRGLAATVVMLGHAFEYYPLTDFESYCTRVLFNGLAAVVVFFVLSGFVLTNALRGASLSKVEIGSFYIRRAFRIYPAIWAASALGLFYILALHFNDVPTNTSTWFDRFYNPERLGFIYIAASLAGMLAFILPPLWSIFVEIVASCAMPFIAFLAYHKRALFLSMLALSLLASLTVGTLTYYWVGVHLVYFFAGAAICAFPTTFVQMWHNLGRLKALLFVASCVGLFATRAVFPETYPTAALYLIDGLFAVLIVSGIAVGDIGPAVLRNRLLVWLGDISYSIYLLHFPVMSIVGKVIATVGIDFDPMTTALLLAMLTAVITLPLSWFVYLWVEKPGIRAGRGAVEWWRKPTSRPTAETAT